MHKTKQKRDRNRTTTSLVLDSSMLRGSRKFRLKPANLVAFKLSVFERHRISFLKIFLVLSEVYRKSHFEFQRKVHVCSMSIYFILVVIGHRKLNLC